MLRINGETSRRLTALTGVSIKKGHPAIWPLSHLAIDVTELRAWRMALYGGGGGSLVTQRVQHPLGQDLHQSGSNSA